MGEIGNDDKFEPNRQELLVGKVGVIFAIIASIICAILGAGLFGGQSLFEVRESRDPNEYHPVKKMFNLGSIEQEGKIPTKAPKIEEIICEKKKVIDDEGTTKTITICNRR